MLTLSDGGAHRRGPSARVRPPTHVTSFSHCMLNGHTLLTESSIRLFLTYRRVLQSTRPIFAAREDSPRRLLEVLICADQPICRIS